MSEFLVCIRKEIGANNSGTPYGLMPFPSKEDRMLTAKRWRFRTIQFVVRLSGRTGAGRYFWCARY